MSEIADPIPSLTVFVTRPNDAFSDATGTGLLISPRLVLTALHVVCDFGHGKTVPVQNPGIRVSFQVAGGPLSPAHFFHARLVWPPVGSPACEDGKDIALLALDNEGLEQGHRDRLSEKSVDAARVLIERYRLASLTKLLRFHLSRENAVDATIIGYPVVADFLLRNVMQNRGREDVRACMAVMGKIPTPTPVEGILQFHTDRLLQPASEEDNPLRGISGASAYRFDVKTGFTEIYGTVNRRLKADVGVDVLTLAPIPSATTLPGEVNFRALVTDFVYNDAPIKEEPLQRAREVLHRLDRKETVRTYFEGYRRKCPRSYLYVFVATQWDGHAALWKRLEEESVVGSAAFFDKIFDHGLDSITLQEMTHEADFSKVLEVLSKKIKATAPDDIAIGQRLSSGAEPRQLRFEVMDHRLFNRATGETLAGVATTLRRFMQSLADWGKNPLVPPLGNPFQRENPLVALLTVYMKPIPGESPDDASDRVGDLVQRVLMLFDECRIAVEDLHCEVYDRVLNEIPFHEFRDWCVEHVQDPEFVRTLGRAMNPQFTIGETRFGLIETGIDAVSAKMAG